jgi:vacuolar-type H+-ATPase subunit I/STV1
MADLSNCPVKIFLLFFPLQKASKGRGPPLLRAVVPLLSFLNFFSFFHFRKEGKRAKSEESINQPTPAKRPRTATRDPTVSELIEKLRDMVVDLGDMQQAANNRLDILTQRTADMQEELHDVNNKLSKLKIKAKDPNLLLPHEMMRRAKEE